MNEYTSDPFIALTCEKRELLFLVVEDAVDVFQKAGVEESPVRSHFLYGRVVARRIIEDFLVVYVSRGLLFPGILVGMFQVYVPWYMTR